jgi:hypothetical protein
MSRIRSFIVALYEKRTDVSAQMMNDVNSIHSALQTRYSAKDSNLKENVLFPNFYILYVCMDLVPFTIVLNCVRRFFVVNLYSFSLGYLYKISFSGFQI